MVLTQAATVRCYHPPGMEAKRLLSGLLEGTYNYDEVIDHFTGRITSRLGWGTPNEQVELNINTKKLMYTLLPVGRIAILIP